MYSDVGRNNSVCLQLLGERERLVTKEARISQLYVKLVTKEVRKSQLSVSIVLVYHK